MKSVFLWVLLPVFLGYQPAASQSASQGQDVPPSSYTLRKGDVFDIKFFYNPELNEQVTVRPDGRVALQLIGEVQADGVQLAGLTSLLEERYARNLANPKITILVRNFALQKLFVDGEVVKPGMIDLPGKLTVVQSIALAGGFRETARERDVLLIRRNAAGGATVTHLDLKQARTSEGASADLPLEPFDVVYVPRSKIANVNKWVDEYIRKNLPITFTFFRPVY